MKGRNNKTLIVFDKLINKLFVGKTIKKDKFSYEFISSSINSYDYDRVDIKINVITPKKGQSYFKGIFIKDVKEIISKIEISALAGITNLASIDISSSTICVWCLMISAPEEIAESANAIARSIEPS